MGRPKTSHVPVLQHSQAAQKQSFSPEREKTKWTNSWMWLRYPDIGCKALVFSMWKWKAESRNRWAMVKGEEYGSSLPPTLCHSCNLGMQQQCQDWEGESPSAVSSSNQKRGHYRPPCGYAWGEGKGEESAALTAMVVLGSQDLNDRKREEKTVWGWEMAGTLVCETSDCAAGLQEQSV